MPITSLQNPAVKRLRSLSVKKFRDETGLFVAEGEEVLSRARLEGWEPVQLVSTTEMAPWGKAERITVSGKVMASLSSQNNPPQLLGVFKRRYIKNIDARGVWIALEDIRDPGNLGSIIRTTDAVGARGVILAGNACDPYSPECVRASMGSIFGPPIVRMTLAQFRDSCRSWPGEIVGTHLQGNQDYRSFYPPPCILVMGNEGKGLSPETAALCSRLVRIPMKGGAESLNVAVAAALMLYEAVKP